MLLCSHCRGRHSSDCRDQKRSRGVSQPCPGTSLWFTPRLRLLRRRVGAVKHVLSRQSDTGPTLSPLRTRLRECVRPLANESRLTQPIPFSYQKQSQLLRNLAGATELEPATACVMGRRSRQLNCAPET